MVAKVAHPVAVGTIVRSTYDYEGAEVPGVAEVTAVKKAGRTYVYDLAFLGSGEPETERTPASLVTEVLAPTIFDYMAPPMAPKE